MASSDESETENTAAPPPRPFQFSLRKLLAAPLWLALVLGSIAWLGIPGLMLLVFISCLGYTIVVRPSPAARYPFRRRYVLLLPVWLVLVMWFFAYSAEWSNWFIWLLDLAILLLSWGAALFCIGMGLSRPSMHWFCFGMSLAFVNVVLTLPFFVCVPRETVRRMECTKNLAQIGAALRSYHDEYRCLPPAYVADAGGRPMYSWRVLILPYLGQKGLSDQWRWDEPWDGANNIGLSQTPLAVFQCPSQPSSASSPASQTSYLAVVGPETAWPGAESTCFEDFLDGRSRTILVVEVLGSGVQWAEPRDLDVARMAPCVNRKTGEGISSAHPEGAYVLFANGKVQFVSDMAGRGAVDAMLTIAGGETPRRRWF